MRPVQIMMVWDFGDATHGAVTTPVTAKYLWEVLSSAGVTNFTFWREGVLCDSQQAFDTSITFIPTTINIFSN